MARFDPQVAQWEYWAKHRDPHYYDALLAFMPERCGLVLDAGCGSGNLAVRLAARSDFVIGLDLSAGMLALAQRRQAQAKYSNIAWVQGRLESVSVPSSAFDYVVSANVLHHLDLNCALPELKRLIKPRGRLALKDVVPRSSDLASRLSFFRLTLSLAADVLTTYGVIPAWHIIAARLRELPTRRREWFAGTTPALLREFCTQLFPGCQLQLDNTILLLWENTLPA